jgi:signal transduction histidine kinase
VSVGEPADSDALRRTLRDMVALSVLPAVWGQFEPRQLAASLAQVVRETLIVPIVYVRLDADEEVASTHRICSDSEVADIGRAFAQTTGDEPIPNPLGTGMLRCARVPIAWRGGQWTLIAGGVEPTFPTLEERMLLSAAANHAAVALERASAFRALRDSEQRAETANRDKDEFLANVSHEIRTPMNAILGMTELTLETSLTDEQRGWLGAVKSAGEHLLVIIESLLDFSKVGASKIELDLAELSVRDQLAALVRGLIARAYKKGLELVVDVHDDVPDLVIGDAGRLRQILINLLENAIKFTAAGDVLLTVSLGDTDLPAPDCELRFAVRDTGIGIPEHQHQSIFEAFTQADSTTTRRFGGTGLGLTIATKLAALMHGEITVSSEAGVGSTFTLNARVRRADGDTKVATPQWPGIRALVVNENVTAGDVLERWLRGWGMEVDVVRDGGSATDLLLQALGARKYITSS